jgi:hypothetical protein
LATIEKRKAATVVKTEAAVAEQERKAKLLVVITGLLLSAFAVLPFFFMGDAGGESNGLEIAMPVTHDMHLHYEQIESFHQGLKDGQIYPRWEEDTNHGFGAPTTCYYPPGIYYITSTIYLISSDWIHTILNLHLLLMFASAAGIYFYARQRMSRAASAIAMAAYIFLPYHLIDQYQRGALAELLSFVWMPPIMLFSERLFKASESNDSQIKSDQTRLSQMLLNLACLALSIAAFLWSHPPTAYQFLLCFGIITLVFAYLRRDLKGLVLVGAGSALGLALSAAYLYPASIEQDLIQHEYVSRRWPYHESYIFWHNIPDRQYHLAFFNLLDSVWVISAIAIVGSAVLLLFFKRHFTKQTSGLYERVILWTTLGGVASFLMTRLSYPIGKYIPKIEIGVFTWRMTSITTLAVALLAGACMQAGLNAKEKSREGAFNVSSIVAAFITTCAILFSVFYVITPIYGATAFVPELEHINDAMIPHTAPSDPRELPYVEPAELLNGNGDVFVDTWKTEHRLIRADLSSDDRLMIRTFYFPGWVITVDGQPAKFELGKATYVKSETGDKKLVRANGGISTHQYLSDPANAIFDEQSLGDIVIDLTAGHHEIKLDFEETPHRRTGRIITIVSFALTVLLIAAGLIMRRRVTANTSPA